MSQTYPNFELIIVDDGSTDDSIDIIGQYEDKRIKIVENGHDFIKSLNLGIKHAKGKYIVRMDADDVMLPHRLETQFNYMENNPGIAICGSWAEAFGANHFTMKTYISHHDIVSRLLLMNTLFHPTIIMRGSTIRQFPGYPDLYKDEYPCAEDYKLWTEMALAGYRFATIPEVLLKYRLSANQSTNMRHKDMLLSSSQIRFEYAEGVMRLISDKENGLMPLFNMLNELVNEGKIRLHQLPDIIYSIYLNYL